MVVTQSTNTMPTQLVQSPENTASVVEEMVRRAQLRFDNNLSKFNNKSSDSTMGKSPNMNSVSDGQCKTFRGNLEATTTFKDEILNNLPSVPTFKVNTNSMTLGHQKLQ